MPTRTVSSDAGSDVPQCISPWSGDQTLLGIFLCPSGSRPVEISPDVWFLECISENAITDIARKIGQEAST